jgi:hypothetical protein
VVVLLVVIGARVVVGEPDGGGVAELSVGVVSELEAEPLSDALDDPLEGSPRERLEDALVELPVDTTDDVLVRDPIVELLISPVPVDDEVMGELVSLELDDDDTGKPSVPVLSGV